MKSIKVKKGKFKTILTYGNVSYIIKGINCEVMKNLKNNVKKIGILMTAFAVMSQATVYADDLEVEKVAYESPIEENNEVTIEKTADNVISATNIVNELKTTDAGKTVNKVTVIKKAKRSVRVKDTINLKTVKALKNKDMKELKYKTNKKGVVKVSKSGLVAGLKPGKVTVSVKEEGAVIAKVKVTVKQSYEQDQLRLLSSIIFCEANTESYAGKKAVGIVVMNRMASSSFPSTMKDVIYQKGQFVPAHTGFLAKAYKMYDSGSLPSECIKAAKSVLSGSRSVNINGKEKSMKGFLFFSRYVPNKKMQIGAHQFK